MKQCRPCAIWHVQFAVMSQALPRQKRWPQQMKETHVHVVACNATLAGGAFMLQQRHKLLPLVNGLRGVLVHHDVLHCFKNSCTENQDVEGVLTWKSGSTRLCHSLMQPFG